MTPKARLIKLMQQWHRTILKSTPIRKLFNKPKLRLTMHSRHQTVLIKHSARRKPTHRLLHLKRSVKPKLMYKLPKQLKKQLGMQYKTSRATLRAPRLISARAKPKLSKLNKPSKTISRPYHRLSAAWTNKVLKTMLPKLKLI